MKKITLLLLFFNCAIINAQHLGENRKTITANTFIEYSKVTNAVKKNGGLDLHQLVPANSKFTVVDQTANDYIVYFWNWDSSNPYYGTLNFDSALNEPKYFLIPKINFDFLTEKLYKRFSPQFGALTFPFRYRPQHGKFENSFTMSLTGGLNWNPYYNPDFTISGLIGVGASNISISKYDVAEDSGITENTDRGAVTLSFSLLFQWEHLQIGLSTGIDNLLSNEKEQWIYNGKQWLSLGVGIAIFTPTEVKRIGSN